jgi:putative transposase
LLKDLMAVRVVPPNARSLTGQLAATKSVGRAEFESSLERDWLVCLERDPMVVRFEVQPVRVEYTDERGRARSYTPDVLVSYGDGRPPTLFEVKHRVDLDPAGPAERLALVRKFRAARAFVQVRGWRFRVVSEREIRGVAVAPGVMASGAVSSPMVAPDLEGVAADAWAIALWRLEVIRPLLGAAAPTRAEVEARARWAGVNTATVYRWIARYLPTGAVSVLVPSHRGPVRGSRWLAPPVEAVIAGAIGEEYERPEQPRVSDAVMAVAAACHTHGLRTPARDTVRRRVRRREAEAREAVIAAREGTHAARRTRPAPGHFPHAEVPHAVVQMDHTKLDVIVVDEVHRRPVGRPWLTLAIDVASRMVAGLYVSLDPPGALSAGLCLAHAMLPKAAWLATLELPSEVAIWPWHGRMGTVHLDNAKEFRGDLLRRACAEYGITIEWRPVRVPEYGGHIERLGGTLSGDLHRLPGTTKSNPQAKGDYDAEGRAALTLAELERWLVLDVIGIYHRRRHGALGASPLSVYNAHRAATSGPELGADARLADPVRVRLDFTPAVERTVQRGGVVVDRVHYYADVLRQHFGPDAEGRRPPVRLKRDPRDISVLYYHDGVRYHAVPYRDLGRPAASVWELRAATRQATDPSVGGRADADETMIFAALAAMRAIEAEAVETTTGTRRAAERRRRHETVHQITLPGPGPVDRGIPPGPAPAPVEELDVDLPPPEPYPTEMW